MRWSGCSAGGWTWWKPVPSATRTFCKKLKRIRNSCMPRSLQAYLWDIEQAVSDIQLFTRGKRLDEYEKDAMLRAAVERNFEVIGEALSQALRFFPQIKGR